MGRRPLFLRALTAAPDCLSDGLRISLDTAVPPGMKGVFGDYIQNAEMLELPEKTLRLILDIYDADSRPYLDRLEIVKTY